MGSEATIVSASYLNSELILSHLSESNQRPTDYKSVALPAELKWHKELISKYFHRFTQLYPETPSIVRDLEFLMLVLRIENLRSAELKWHLH